MVCSQEALENSTSHQKVSVLCWRVASLLTWKFYRKYKGPQHISSPSHQDVSGARAASCMSHLLMTLPGGSFRDHGVEAETGTMDPLLGSVLGSQTGFQADSRKDWMKR